MSDTNCQANRLDLPGVSRLIHVVVCRLSAYCKNCPEFLYNAGTIAQYRRQTFLRYFITDDERKGADRSRLAGTRQETPFAEKVARCQTTQLYLSVPLAARYLGNTAAQHHK